MITTTIENNIVEVKEIVGKEVDKLENRVVELEENHINNKKKWVHTLENDHNNIKEIREKDKECEEEKTTTAWN